MSPADRDTARAQLEDQLARMEQASALHRHDWLVLKDAIAQALAEVRAEEHAQCSVCRTSPRHRVAPPAPERREEQP